MPDFDMVNSTVENLLVFFIAPQYSHNIQFSILNRWS